MKNAVFVGLLVAFAALWFVLGRKQREMFVPEFLDQRNVAKTSKTRQSSYKQETNHFSPMPYPEDPIPGVATPFRVNMYDSYMV
jgi:hypothetical protein